VALQNQWNQLLMETMRVMYPLFDIGLRIATVFVKLLPTISAIGAGFFGVYSILTKIGTKTGEIAKVASSMVEGIQFVSTKIANGFKVLVGGVSKIIGLGGILSKFSFVTPFLKMVPVIGLVISGFQAISGFIQGWQSGTGFFDSIVKGFKGAFNAVFGFIIDGFIAVKNSILDKLGFGGHSPSEIGLSILKGISSTSGMIFDALSDPWRRFLAWMAEKIPFFGEGLVRKIRGGMSGALETITPVERKVTDIQTTPTVIKSEEIPGSKAITSVDTSIKEQTKSENDSMTLTEILKSLNILNSNLISGKIGLYVDGQLLSSVLHRQTAFRGGYGTNNIVMT
jgi:hypothetical protein